MANEIDLYDDLRVYENKMKYADSKDEKEFWANAVKNKVDEICENYPDLKLD